MSKWISVEDALPDEYQSVLIYRMNRGVGNAFRHGDVYRQDGWGDISEFAEIIDVTHWMPLPEPPTE